MNKDAGTQKDASINATTLSQSFQCIQLYGVACVHRRTPGLAHTFTCSFLASLLSRIPVPYVLLWALEEINVCIRGCFLLMLFLPAVCTAHLAFRMGGEKRQRWMQLMIWTLHQVRGQGCAV